LVIGGGVTGAAVAFEAARRGLRTAVVERGDFASGTSSRSSKLIHGGLRYLRDGQIRVTRESVRERQALLREAPGLVDPLTFLMPHFRGRPPGRAMVALGLAAYDLLAGSWQHRYLGREQTMAAIPSLDAHALSGAHSYVDAITDDARLVLRLIAEAQRAGAVAINYAAARLDVTRECVTGAKITDALTGATVRVRAAAVVAATGVFADELRAELGATARLRPLRGSHLVISGWRLSLKYAVAFQHPDDGRLMFAYPWEGATLAGTTDLDYHEPLDREPSITANELQYLLFGLRLLFPALRLAESDVIATFAGIRPVVAGSANGAPSRLSREHVVWQERGLITITGGKLTTFRPMALDALAAAAPSLPAFDLAPRPVFNRQDDGASNDATLTPRLTGRYGIDARAIVASPPDELEPIGSTNVLWAELRWSARNEMVVHLDDLLLRRTRVGLLLRDGGLDYADRVGVICRTELNWTEAHWNAERNRYVALWRTHYSPFPTR
jgi:glycerol-3-phosphate dehydrogenase